MNKQPLYPNSIGWLFYFISAIFFFYEFILRVSPGVMAEELRYSFHMDANGLGLMGSIFFQAYAWMQLPAGILFDKYNWSGKLTQMGLRYYTAAEYQHVFVMLPLVLIISAALCVTLKSPSSSL